MVKAEACVGNIVVDADRKMILRFCECHVVIDRLDHSRCKFL